MTLTPSEMIQALRRVHARTRTEVLEVCGARTLEELVGEAEAASGDTIYAIDRVAEHAYLAAIREEIASVSPVVVVGEGLPSGRMIIPEESPEEEASWQIIVDPIDGTRPFMFQKRSAWIVSGAAPTARADARLSDLQVAVQTELPILKQHLADEFWAQRGQGCHAVRYDLVAGTEQPLTVQPSATTDAAHGYLTLCSFFAGGRDLLGTIADELNRRLLAESPTNEPRIFEDQYCSTAGQLAGLMMGQDRVVIDVRPLLQTVLDRRGYALPHCCHPYDLSSMLIAQEAGVELHAPDGCPLDAPLDTVTNVAWTGYANRALRQKVEPVLQELLRAKLK